MTLNSPINLRLLALTLLGLLVLLAIAINRVNIDFDILNSLPADQPVLEDAKYIFQHHPFQDRVVIDLSSSVDNLPALLEKAAVVEKALKASKLFSQVGFEDSARLVPGLLVKIVDNLPFLFTHEELEKEIKPLLSPDAIAPRLNAIVEQLSGIEGVGQSRLIASDPLELRNLVLKRLGSLNPVQDADFYHGYPLSWDKRHLLLIATPKAAGTDTASSRQIAAVLDRLAEELNKTTIPGQGNYELTAVGAYRAALDNEEIVRRDIQKAILFATIGVTLLLLVSFPRPYLGLLSLIPALVGTVSAFFICALIHSSLSILAIGFGGAIISITVDHSIAYLLFVDRPEKVFVHQAATEVRSIGLIAVLTTIAAFLVLTLSGFSILAQIGQFAALGIAGSFLFVHTLLPKLIPVIPPARKQSPPWLLVLVNKQQGSHSKIVLAITILFGLVMIGFAAPKFNADLQHMNTVRPQTLAAEQKLSATWGNISSKIHLVMAADSLEELQTNSDLVTRELEPYVQSGKIAAPFMPTALFPGQESARKNLEAWREFWNPARREELDRNLSHIADQLGFMDTAFRSFAVSLQGPWPEEPGSPVEFAEILNIRQEPRNGKWMLFTTITPLADFDSSHLRSRLSDQVNLHLFDPALFSSELGHLLTRTFLIMLAVIGCSVIVLIWLFFLDWKLTLLALTPIAFSLVCTLGTMNLLGQPLDIAGLMLAIIVVGMGIDYSLFMIRSYQRYSDENHPFHGLIRMAIVLAAVSTMLGFGALVTAEHNLLFSAGLVSLLGIGFAWLATFVLLPPVLRRIFINRTGDLRVIAKGKTRYQRVLSRYAKMEAHPRMFTRFKLKLDPMFAEIDGFLDNPERIIDIGCGYGVPAAWILDLYPAAIFYGLDPDPERVRVANKALGANGRVQMGTSPELPIMEAKADLAMMLDMMHYLTNEQLYQAFTNLKSALTPSGKLLIRVTLPLIDPMPWYRRIETLRIRLKKGRYYYRPLSEIVTLLEQCGFGAIQSRPSGKNREETWITAQVVPEAPIA